MNKTPIIGPMADALADFIVVLGVVGGSLAVITLLFVHWLKHRHDV